MGRSCVRPVCRAAANLGTRKEQDMTGPIFKSHSACAKNVRNILKYQKTCERSRVWKLRYPCHAVAGIAALKHPSPVSTAAYSAARSSSAPPRSTLTNRLMPFSIIVTPNNLCIRLMVTALCVTMR